RGVDLVQRLLLAREILETDSNLSLEMAIMHANNALSGRSNNQQTQNTQFSSSPQQMNPLIIQGQQPQNYHTVYQQKQLKPQQQQFPPQQHFQQQQFIPQQKTFTIRQEMLPNYTNMDYHLAVSTHLPPLNLEEFSTEEVEDNHQGKQRKL